MKEFRGGGVTLTNAGETVTTVEESSDLLEGTWAKALDRTVPAALPLPPPPAPSRSAKWAESIDMGAPIPPPALPSRGKLHSEERFRTWLANLADAYHLELAVTLDHDDGEGTLMVMSCGLRGKSARTVNMPAYVASLVLNNAGRVYRRRQNMGRCLVTVRFTNEVGVVMAVGQYNLSLQDVYDFEAGSLTALIPRESSTAKCFVEAPVASPALLVPRWESGAEVRSSNVRDAPEALRPHLPQLFALMRALGVRCWVAGGALRDPIAGYPERKDVDVFFPRLADYEKAHERLLAHEGGNQVKQSKWATTFVTPWGTLDLVSTRFAPSPAETIRTFDFVSCAAAVSLDEYVRHEDFERDAYARVLRVYHPHRKNSPTRAKRFVERGWRFGEGEEERLKSTVASLAKGADGDEY